MTSGMSLSDVDRDEIYRISVNMAKQGMEYCKDGRIIIRTKYESAGLGTISGFLFNAEVVTKIGVNKQGKLHNTDIGFRWY